jgi:hypothetical protein
MSTSTSDLQDLLHRVRFFLEIDECFGTVVLGEFLSFIARINYNRPNAHCRGQLHTLDADTTATAYHDQWYTLLAAPKPTWEYSPVASPEVGMLHRRINGRRRAHDWSSHVV